MKMVPLRDIATVDISNVDKKSKDGEQEVVLCNFVDVYHNWAITKEMVPSLMKATANPEQIRRFGIHKGQVAITKDSETRDDIGIPTYIADDIDGGVLGYHCALITPDESVLRGKYLNIVMHSPYAQKYFEANASGSGQRYTLTTDIIGGFPVPLPDDIGTQDDFGKLCSDIDAKISNNTAICSELKSMAKLLYDYWFVQFDFPDEDGNPYKTSGGQMVWNDEQKCEIPEGWEVLPLKRLASYANEKIDSSGLSASNYIGMDNLLPDMKGRTLSDYAPLDSSCIKFNPNDVLLGNIRPYFKKIWFSDRVGGSSPDVLVIQSRDKEEAAFVYGSLARDSFFDYDTAGAKGSKMPRGDKDHIMAFSIPYSKELAIKYANYVSCWLKKTNEMFVENLRLASLRDFLLPMLMNGQITVGEAKEHIAKIYPKAKEHGMPMAAESRDVERQNGGEGM